MGASESAQRLPWPCSRAQQSGSPQVTSWGRAGARVGTGAALRVVEAEAGCACLCLLGRRWQPRQAQGSGSPQASGWGRRRWQPWAGCLARQRRVAGTSPGTGLRLGLGSPQALWAARCGWPWPLGQPAPALAAPGAPAWAARSLGLTPGVSSPRGPQALPAPTPLGRAPPAQASGGAGPVPARVACPGGARLAPSRTLPSPGEAEQTAGRASWQVLGLPEREPH